jgi:hypothetical protein
VPSDDDSFRGLGLSFSAACMSSRKPARRYAAYSAFAANEFRSGGWSSAGGRGTPGLGAGSPVLAAPERRAAAERAVH